MVKLTDRQPYPPLVAHRGYALRYPENSLEGIEAALRAGARFVEFDIQMSADQIPMVIHDAQLQRTTGVDGLVYEKTAHQLSKLGANERSRFGDRFSGIQIPTLAALVDRLSNWPNATAFVELKRSSLNRFGTETVVKRVLEVVQPILPNCVLISFSSNAVIEARRQGAHAVGWVMGGWDSDNHRTADQLAPDFLFCDHEDLPPYPARFRPGPWSWVPYEIDSADLALELMGRGAQLIETMAFNELRDELDSIADTCVEQTV